MKIRETDHQDSSPCLRDPEKSMFILGAIVFPGENTKVLAHGDILTSLSQVLSVGTTMGFPFYQVNAGYYTMVPQGLGEHFKVK